MCLPITDHSMLGWLRNQRRVVAAWRSELLRRSETELEDMRRVQKHYDWLSTEITRLEQSVYLAAR